MFVVVWLYRSCYRCLSYVDIWFMLCCFVVCSCSCLGIVCYKYQWFMFSVLVGCVYFR